MFFLCFYFSKISLRKEHGIPSFVHQIIDKECVLNKKSKICGKGTIFHAERMYCMLYSSPVTFIMIHPTNIYRYLYNNIFRTKKLSNDCTKII